MSADGKKLYVQVVEEHQARLARLAERRGVGRLKRVYEQSQAEVEAKLKKLVRAGKGNTFTAHNQRMVLAQLTEGQAYVARRMTGELGDAAKDAQSDTLHALYSDLNRLESKFSGSSVVLPIEDAARFRGVIDKRSTSLLKRHESSLNEYGARNVAKIEGALASSLLQGESQMQAIDRVVEVIDGEWWQGERIVRTELAWASNATQADGLHSVRETLTDMMMQWRELVNDAGLPLDKRVGVDSLAMHGQLAIPGGSFQCPARAPDGEDVPDGLVGEEVQFPPNRPNDRATLAPWRPGWGIPGWRYVNGRRVQMR